MVRTVSTPSDAVAQTPSLDSKKEPKVKEAKVKEPKEAKVKEPKEAKVKEPKEAKVKEPKEAKVKEPKEAKVKEPKEAKVKVPKEAKVKALPVGDEEGGEEVEATNTTIDKIMGNMTEIGDCIRERATHIQAIKALDKAINVYFASANKLLVKDKRDEVKREVKKTKARTATRESGLNKPIVVSEQMREFLNVGPEEVVTRRMVGTAIHNYLVENNLRRPEDKRLFEPDAKLNALFGITTPDPTLGYFTLHKYTKQHFGV